ncbi:MAG: Pvc16 family protein [Kibdelosporangium sp.]
MLNLLDESLAEFLRAVVPLPKREIDISFDAPDKDWSARVSRPTINMYLWDVRRNTSERDFGMETVHDSNGRPHRRTPLPRVDCRYLVTAWTSDIRDEHSLLGATLAALLQHTEIEAEYLQGAYAKVKPLPSIEIAAGDGRENSDFWSALGGQLKPGLDVTVTATVDSALLVAAGPPVHQYAIVTKAGDAAPEERLFIGGQVEGSLVSTPHGAVQPDEDGKFLVPAEVGDQVSVDGTVRGEVPATGPLELKAPPKRKR